MAQLFDVGVPANSKFSKQKKNIDAEVVVSKMEITCRHVAMLGGKVLPNETSLENKHQALFGQHFWSS